MADPESWGAVALAIVVVALCVLYPLGYYLVDRKGLRRFPAPSPIAALTPFWVIYHNWHGRRFLAIEEAHRRLGPVVRIAPDHVSFSSPRAYKEIYGHGSPILKDIFYDNLAGNTPAMADTTSREVHSVKRRNVSAIFSAKHVTAMEPKVMTAVGKLLDAIRLKSEGRKVSESDRYATTAAGQFDLRPWLNMFSFDAFSSMLWSAPYGFLDRGNDDCFALSDDLKTVTPVHAMDTFRTGVHFNTLCAQMSPTSYRLARSIARILRIRQRENADHFAGMARYMTVNRLKQTKSPSDDPDFFTHFPLEATDKRPVPMSLVDLVAECTSFLNAGNDTTQISLTNTMFLLASHPEKQQKLYEALVEAVPEESRPIAPYAQLQYVQYLRACLDESLRLHPPVRFGLPRRTVGAGSTIAGHHIPGDVTVSYSLHNLHRDETLFHRPLDYVPERWLPENPDVTETERQNLRDYVLPFTLGGRACIGRNLAYMELSICLAALVMQFEWYLSADAKRSYTHFERFNSSPVELMISAKLRR